MNYVIVYQDDYLAHHGVKGMKWGVRRYRNTDGTLTTEGKRRYGVRELDRKTIERYAAITKERDRIHKSIPKTKNVAKRLQMGYQEAAYDKKLTGKEFKKAAKRYANEYGKTKNYTQKGDIFVNKNTGQSLKISELSCMKMREDAIKKSGKKLAEPQ